MVNGNGHLTKAEFQQFEKRMDDRLDILEKKMDKLSDKVLYGWGFAGGIGLVAGVVSSIIF